MSAGAEALITEHLPLARKLAATMARRMPLPKEEIESAAMLGLVQAARAFDPTRGGDFVTFARRRITGAVQDEARGADTLSRDQRRALKEGKPGINVPVHDDYDDLAERISGGDQLCSVEAWTSVQHLHELMRHLPRRLQRVVRRHLIDEVPLATIGAELGVTESRACQLLGEAKERIRVRLLPPVDDHHRRPRGGQHHQRHCPAGHELVGYNLAFAGRKRYRVCRRCRVERVRRWRYANGTKPFASFRPPPQKLRKLSADQVKEILAALSARERIAAIARRYGVVALVIRLIRDGKTYRDVPRPPGFAPIHLPIGKLTAAQAQAIANRLAAGARNCDLAAEFGVGETAISDIRHRRHHRGIKLSAIVATDARHQPSPKAKLTADQVREVRAALAARKPVAAIAREAGVAWHTIKLLRDGRTYKHVTQP